MNIVVIDGYTLNPGDQSWENISKIGKLTIYDRTSAADIVERCRDAEVVITNKVPFTAATLEQLPKLKMIAVTATGYNIIDTATARKRDIVVSNVPSYGTASVAQHAFSLILELTNHVGANSASVAAGDWQKAPDWCYTVAPVMELEGKTLGIIGYGNIGQRMSLIAQAFGMKVLYYSPGDKPWTPDERADLPTLFANSDVVSLHAPLTSGNEKFVNKDLLKRMKPTAFLINTARGPLIDEHDLAEALNNGWIAGAGLDVLSVEPPTDSNPLLKAKNCIITPHMSWISREARERIMEMTEANIKAFLDGSEINRVG
ncbi:MAG: glycerate dehydrogenase [Sphingobacteriales bacterium 50-39]|nr:D-2-hydroxyacid dehydrogenase [Sphingobacteriales bacterium]OJW54758.1 MAG: glycerate dehydrogenase [Sphingobacteriales bacterium 50-39]